MTIAVKCPKCKHISRVNDSLAGKSARCPSCRGIVRIPGGSSSDAAAAVAGSSPSQTSGGGDAWYVRTPDGETFGPITRAELDAWVGEDRIDADCYVLQKGQKEWHAAADVFPQLAGAAATFATGGGGGFEVDPDPAPSGGGRRVPNVHRRQYPAMNIVIVVFYVLAGLTGLSFLYTSVWIIRNMWELVDIGVLNIDDLLGALFVNMVVHAGIIATWLFIAELGRIVKDIQGNTQETAHYTKVK